MKKSLLLVLPLVLTLNACGTLQPMFERAWERIDKVFDSPTPAPSPEPGPAPPASYDQSALECNQEASRPNASVDFNACMRARGHEVVPPKPAP